MSRVKKVTNSLNLDKWKNQIFETQIEPVACIVSYTQQNKKSCRLTLPSSLLSHIELKLIIIIFSFRLSDLVF